MFRCTPEGPKYLLILDGYDNWGLPKGHIDSGESEEQAARREVAEETGLEDLVLHEQLDTIDWYFRFRGRLIHKYCHYFLFEAPHGRVVPQSEEGISACRWLDADAALETISYNNARALLQHAVERAPQLCRKAASQ